MQSALEHKENQSTEQTEHSREVFVCLHLSALVSLFMAKDVRAQSQFVAFVPTLKQDPDCGIRLCTSGRNGAKCHVSVSVEASFRHLTI